MTARLHFMQLDRDRSGVLDGDELAAAGAADVDGDGRVLLRELSPDARLFEATGTSAPATRQPAAFLATRVDTDGDLARLLDGVVPFEFDADKDRKLDRAELARAFFAALDLDGDKSLSVDELSRHPGDLRQLRYRGAWAKERLSKIDDNKDGKLQARELVVADEDFTALDLDRDGFVALGEPANPYWENRGVIGRRAEWPTRRADFVRLPLDATRERVLAVFDSDHDGSLTTRELRKRPDLMLDFDRNGDTLVGPEEIDGRVNVVINLGVDACPDDFVGRWDLDGDGKVADDELPAAARIALGRRRTPR
jgi:Ca2+-binding EF-hand superfamily protein